MKKTENPAERKGRILVSVYSSSMGLSITALAIAVVLEIVMLVYTLINSGMYGPYLWRYRIFYISLMAVAAVALVLSLYVKKDIPNRFKILNYASPIYAVFLFAWALGVTYSDFSVTGVVDPTVFMTFSLIVPLSVFLFPTIYAIIVAAANTVIIILSVSAANSPGPLINIVIFVIFQVVLGINFLRLKVKLAERIIEEQDNADVDVLTGLFNRRSYEEDLGAYASTPVPENLVYIAIDINRLKTVNDQFGHSAGDKLIVGIAECMEKCFGEMGKLYRIGGDEFAAILTPTSGSTEALLTAFEESLREWSAINDMELTASFGCVSASDFLGEKIEVIAKTADAEMYKKKALYYQAKR